MLAAVYRGRLLVISDSDQVPFLRATRRAGVPAESGSVGAVVRRTARILPSMSARPRFDCARATTLWLRAALTRAARRSARRPPRRPPSLGTPTAEHKGVRRILQRAGFISPRTLKRRRNHFCTRSEFNAPANKVRIRDDESGSKFTLSPSLVASGARSPRRARRIYGCHLLLSTHA